MPLRDFALLVTVCLVWASNNVLSKYVVSDLHVAPFFYAAARFVLVTLALFPFLRPMPPPRVRLVAAAFVMGAGNFGLLFVGLKYAAPSTAAIVMQLNMPATLVLSRLFLGERVSPRRAAGIALTALGVLTVMWDSHGFTLSPGLLLIAGSAVMYAVGVVLTKEIEGLRPLTFQAWVGATSVIPLTAASVIFEPGQLQGAIQAGWIFWIALVFSAFVVSVGAHTFFIALLQRHEANLLSALSLLTPLFTIILGVVLLHDPFGARLGAGSVLTLIGVLIIALRRKHVNAVLGSLRLLPTWAVRRVGPEVIHD
jgi:drug/metabolite transporter (DMT)-like permease